MSFKNFNVQIFIRLAFILSLLLALSWLIPNEKYVSAIIVGLLLIGLTAGLFYYINSVNDRLARFFDAVRFDDFVMSFEEDNKLGSSFKKLNMSMKAVITAFHETRSETEAQYQFLDSIVNHVKVGLIVHDSKGKIVLMNPACLELLGIEKIQEIEHLQNQSKRTHEAIKKTDPASSQLYFRNEQFQLIIHSEEIKLQNQDLKIISIQNIQSELSQKEIESWQNLSKVLRHEMMNSITPISSLTNTLNQIFVEDFEPKYKDTDLQTVEDIKEALQAIGNRSESLKHFIGSFKEITNIPKPTKSPTNVSRLISSIADLHRSELDNKNVRLEISVIPSSLEIDLDEYLIQQVLVNLVKNGIEALFEVVAPMLKISAYESNDSKILIEVSDNGVGIIPAALSKVTTPFYTTKPEGSGIGLSLSRQIMIAHQGNLQIESEDGIGTKVTLIFG